ncbi:energy-coupling factor ABC transporter ATP-binding protein [Desulfosoma caldarium]|nr:ABC transporter ATP-binding protein [Desulfosoma caldarium]
MPAREFTPSSGMPLYVLDGILQVYGGRPVLSVDRWSVPQGCVLGLVGPNGSGKSTLLRLLAFVESPAQGTLWFQGCCVSRREARNLRRIVTLLPQDPYLLDRSVADNVAYGLRVRGVHGGDRKARVREALRWVGLDPNLFELRRVQALSGGEARRVALAARLVLQPRVLLLDEPTAEIDVESARLVRRAALKARSAWGTTVIITSHDWGWLLGLCDQVYHMHAGHLVGPAPVNCFDGPWRVDTDGRVWKDVGAGQRLVLPAPESLTATAVVEAEHVQIFTHRPEDIGVQENLFHGIVTGLAVYGHDERLLVTVRLAERILLASVSGDQRRAHGLQPGLGVFAWVPSDRCRWL